MSDTMVERVARAMWSENVARVAQVCGDEVLLAPWEDETEALRKDWVAYARAAIAAMRAPSYPSVIAVARSLGQPLSNIDLCFNAMIDTILSETGEGE